MTRDLLLLVLLSLTAYRLTRLAVRDTFPPVLWLRDRLVGGWRSTTEPEEEVARQWARSRDQDDFFADHATHIVPGVGHVQLQGREHGGHSHEELMVWRVRKSWSPYWLAELLSCPWCASGWISGALVLATWITIGVPFPLLAWPAVWAVGAWIASREWA